MKVTFKRNMIVATIAVFAVCLCLSSPLLASPNWEGGHASLACTDCHLTQPYPDVDTRDTVDFVTSAVVELCISCHSDKTILEQTNSPTSVGHMCWPAVSMPQEMYDFYVNWLSAYNEENETSLEGFHIHENDGVYSFDCASCHSLHSGSMFPDIPIDNAEMCVACHGGAGNYDPSVTTNLSSSMPRILYNPQHLGVVDEYGVEYPAPSDPAYNGQPPSDGDSVSGKVPLPVAFFKGFHSSTLEKLNYRVEISGPQNFTFTETDSRPLSWYTGIDGIARWDRVINDVTMNEKQMYQWDTSSMPCDSYTVDLIPYNPTDPADEGTAYTLNLTVLGATVLGANIDIDPDTLNLKSKGNWITCYIELPEGYDVNQIDVNTVTLSVGSATPIAAELSPTEVGDYDNDTIPDLMVKFDRGAVQDVASEGSVEMTVGGSLTDGTTFEGTDTVLILDKGKEHIDEENHSSVVY